MKKQKAKDGNWLYEDQLDGSRFYRNNEIYLPDNVEFWHECTDAEKVEWEETHKPKEVEPIEE